jgi:hypothetical protein
VALSAMYGKILVLLMVAFCLTEVLDNKIRPLAFQVPEGSVARRCYFKPKMPVRVNFGVSCNERCWVTFMGISSILLPFGIFYGQLVYFVVILVNFSFSSLLHQEKSSNPA